MLGAAPGGRRRRRAAHPGGQAASAAAAPPRAGPRDRPGRAARGDCGATICPGRWRQCPPGARVQGAAGARAVERRPSRRRAAGTASTWRTTRSTRGASRRRPSEGGRRWQSGDVAVAAEELRAALDLWRGPALDGSDDDGVLRARGHAPLEEKIRWAVLEDRIDADLPRPVTTPASSPASSSGWRRRRSASGSTAS